MVPQHLHQTAGREIKFLGGGNIPGILKDKHGVPGIMQTRAEREREQYNKGLQWARLGKVLRHCGAYSDFTTRLIDAMSFAQDKVVLEIGSSAWEEWLEDTEIYPAALHAVNISEKELAKGRQKASNSIIKPVFHLMDAHKLEFDDHTFDMVFGGAILHHLDLPIALAEIKRVLKPHGRIVFKEPLGINPIGKAIRYLTPTARTVDEQPFRFKELAILKRHCRI